MAKITAAQKKFLQLLEIPLERLFDATGMRREDYSREMSALGMLVAIGVTPCAKAGHTMRTNAGHCAECRPANLAYRLRFDAPGEVYVARSKSGSITKVGSAKDAMERMRHLNGYQYGGSSDWKIEFCEATSTAGQIEFAAHRALSRYAVTGIYFRDGRDIECREIFNCSVSVAVKAVRAAIANPHTAA
jgi:hypothetical protein